MDELGVGIVGMGKWGQNYLRTIASLNGYRIFIADSNPEVLANFHNCPNIQILSFEDMMADFKIKAIVIATPDNTHHKLASQAIKEGKDVLVEKPMALNPVEAQTMLRLSQKHERILAIGHTALYTQEFEELRHRIESGALGKVTRAETIRTSNGRANADVINDLLPHCLAMAIKLWDEPVALRIEEATKIKIVYKITFARGEVLNGTACWQGPPFIRRFTVFGSRQTSYFNEPLGNNFHFDSLPLTRECRDFLTCCRTRRLPLSDGILGVKVTNCIWRLSIEAEKKLTE
ncbi:MAG: Gfo/Idh/MocA family protein [bacterium]